MIQILSAHKGRVKYKAWIAGGGNTGVITKFCPSQPTHWLPVLLFPHGCKTDSPLLKVPRSDITMQHSLKVPNLMSKPSKCGAEEAAGCHPWTAAPGVLFPSTQGPRKPKRQATYLNTPNTMVGEAQHNGHRDSGWKQGEWKVNSNSFEVRQGKCWISLDYVSSPRKSPLMVWASPSRLLVLLLESFFLPLKGATCWQLSSFSWQLPATEFRGSNDIFSSVLYSFQSKLEVFLLEWFPQEPHGPCLKLTVFCPQILIQTLSETIPCLSLSPADVAEGHGLCPPGCPLVWLKDPWGTPFISGMGPSVTDTVLFCFWSFSKGSTVTRPTSTLCRHSAFILIFNTSATQRSWQFSKSLGPNGFLCKGSPLHVSPSPHKLLQEETLLFLQQEKPGYSFNALRGNLLCRMVTVSHSPGGLLHVGRTQFHWAFLPLPNKDFPASSF